MSITERDPVLKKPTDYKSRLCLFSKILGCLFLVCLVTPALATSPDWTMNIVIDENSWPAEPCLVISDNGSVLAGIFDTTVIILKDDGTIIGNYSQKDTVKTLVMTPDGHGIAAASWKNNLVYLDEKGRRVWTKDLPYSVSALAITGDGHAVLAGGAASGMERGGTLTSFGKDSSIRWTYTAPSAIISVATSEGGDNTAAGAVGNVIGPEQPDADVFFLDKMGRLLWSARTRGDNIVAMDPQATSIAIGARGKNMVYLYNHDGNLLFAFPTRGDVTGVEISPDGEFVYAALTQPASGEREPPAVICLNRKGSLVWKYPVDPIIQDGHFIRNIHRAASNPVLVVGSSSGNVSIVGADGRSVGEYNAGGSLGGVVISGDGMSVAGRTQHTLFFISTKTDPQNSMTPITRTRTSESQKVPRSATRPVPTRSATSPITLVFLAAGLCIIAGFYSSKR